jgi:squalene synthase HpnC
VVTTVAIDWSESIDISLMTDGLVIKIAGHVFGVNAAKRRIRPPTIPAVASPLHGVEHYENFPVASWLMPARLRPAVVAIYRFARHADDVADEGDAPPGERLAALAALRSDIALARAGAAPASPLVAALVPHVQAHALDWSRFEALLDAFAQDVTVTRYADFASLQAYCRRSADPVGQLVLALSGRLDEPNRVLSDRICTALQLINFLQDADVDWRRGRLYLPLDTLARQGIDEQEVDRAVRAGRASSALRACVAAEAQRAGSLLAGGSALPARVGGRLGWELRAVVAGGRRILERLADGGHDPFARRPALTGRDAPALAAAVLRLALHGRAGLPAPHHGSTSR